MSGKATQTKKTTFEDYNAFVEKFESKKTTDDCYTPPAIFNAVVDYVSTLCDLSLLDVVRPFYPAGDYESFDYPSNAIVIDNPPFSIITPIVRYYLARRIKFFLFAPHLTLLTADTSTTAVVVGGDIVYENGAIVKTSFLTNITPHLRVLAAPELYASIKEVQERNKVRLPKYDYPANVLTVSQICKIVENGIAYELKKEDAKHLRRLDAQKPFKKALFGSGLLLSDKAAADKAAADKAAADKAAADKAAADKVDVIIWELSARELGMIAELNQTPSELTFEEAFADLLNDDLC